MTQSAEFKNYGLGPMACHPEGTVLYESGDYAIVSTGKQDQRGTLTYQLKKHGEQWHLSDEFRGLSQVDGRSNFPTLEMWSLVGSVKVSKEGELPYSSVFSLIDQLQHYSDFVVQHTREEVRREVISSVKGIGAPDRTLKALGKGRMNEVTLMQMERRFVDACGGDLSLLDDSLREIYRAVLDALGRKEARKKEKREGLQSERPSFSGFDDEYGDTDPFTLAVNPPPPRYSYSQRDYAPDSRIGEGRMGWNDTSFLNPDARPKRPKKTKKQPNLNTRKGKRKANRAKARRGAVPGAVSGEDVSKLLEEAEAERARKTGFGWGGGWRW